MADIPLHGLTAELAPSLTDIIYLEKDPSGAQLPRQLQLGRQPFIKTINGGEDGLEAQSTISGAVTIDFSLGNNKSYILGGNVTFTFPSPTSGKLCILGIHTKQDGTGGRSVTWPASVKWMPGSNPLAQSGANREEFYQFITEDGGTTWWGIHISQTLLTSQKTADYTLVQNDGWSRIDMSVAGANNLTIPPKILVPWFVGTEILVHQGGAGQTTLVEGSSGGTQVTLNSFGAKKKLAGQYAVASLLYLGGDTWQLDGNLA